MASITNRLFFTSLAGYIDQQGLWAAGSYAEAVTAFYNGSVPGGVMLRPVFITVGNMATYRAAGRSIRAQVNGYWAGRGRGKRCLELDERTF